LRMYKDERRFPLGAYAESPILGPGQMRTWVRIKGIDAETGEEWSEAFAIEHSYMTPSRDVIEQAIALTERSFPTIEIETAYAEAGIRWRG